MLWASGGVPVKPQPRPCVSWYGLRPLSVTPSWRQRGSGPTRLAHGERSSWAAPRLSCMSVQPPISTPHPLIYAPQSPPQHTPLPWEVT